MKAIKFQLRHKKGGWGCFIFGVFLWSCCSTVQASSAIDDLIIQNAIAPTRTHFDLAGSEAKVYSNLPVLTYDTLHYLKENVQRYQKIVDQGGWPYVPNAEILRIGITSPIVGLLRERLQTSGDLKVKAGMPDFFDSFLEVAVKSFQKRHGLTPTGVVGEETYSALNITASERLRQLKVNVERLKKVLPVVRQCPRYIMVNIPAAQLEAVENGKVVQRHTVVVGKVNRQTPVLDSHIIQIIFNPFWVVPKSIIEKDLIPLMRRDPDYLVDNDIHVYNKKGEEIDSETIDWYSKEALKYTFRQHPGKMNAMSSTKLNFPNPYSVYMHDTPEQEVFDDLMRFDSSGCVRVQNIRDLDRWILKNTPGWGRGAIASSIRSRKENVVKVRDMVALHFVYITAWATQSNVVQFRHDIYNKDGLGELPDDTSEVPENEWQPNIQ